jgi:hypothetical protein
MSEIESYTSHNFDAVNEQIDEISKREKARTFAYRLKSFKTLIIYATIIALIVAFLVLIFSWAYRIISAPYVEEKIIEIRPEIIEKEVIRVVMVPVEKTLLDSSGSNYDGPKEPIGSSNSGTSQNIIITDYHTFKTVEANEYLQTWGFKNVITGWKYKDSESDYPESQFCYIRKRTAGGETSIRIDLASLDEDGYVSNVSSRMAREASITRSVLTEAEKKCQWANSD